MELFHSSGISMCPERNSIHRRGSGGLGSPSSATHCLLTWRASFAPSLASVSPLVKWTWPHGLGVTFPPSGLLDGFALSAPGWQGFCRLGCLSEACCHPAASEEPVDSDLSGSLVQKNSSLQRNCPRNWYDVSLESPRGVEQAGCCVQLPRQWAWD